MSDETQGQNSIFLQNTKLNFDCFVYAFNSFCIAMIFPCRTRREGGSKETRTTEWLAANLWTQSEDPQALGRHSTIVVRLVFNRCWRCNWSASTIHIRYCSYGISIILGVDAGPKVDAFFFFNIWIVLEMKIWWGVNFKIQCDHFWRTRTCVPKSRSMSADESISIDLNQIK